jgi:hypothetical protein
MMHWGPERGGLHLGNTWARQRFLFFRPIKLDNRSVKFTRRAKGCGFYKPPAAGIEIASSRPGL